MKCLITRNAMGGLPPEMVLELLWFLPKNDRTAVLDVVDNEVVNQCHRRDLQGMYANVLIRSIRRMRVMRVMRAPDAHLFRWVQNANASMVTIDRCSSDEWIGATVVGTNLRWITTIIGGMVVPGARTYYRHVSRELSVVDYTCPKLFPDTYGVPMNALAFHAVAIRCNPGGVITKVVSTYARRPQPVFDYDTVKHGTYSFSIRCGLLGMWEHGIM